MPFLPLLSAVVTGLLMGYALGFAQARKRHELATANQKARRVRVPYTKEFVPLSFRQWLSSQTGPFTVSQAKAAMGFEPTENINYRIRIGIETRKALKACGAYSDDGKIFNPPSDETSSDPRPGLPEGKKLQHPESGRRQDSTTPPLSPSLLRHADHQSVSGDQVAQPARQQST